MILFIKKPTCLQVEKAENTIYRQLMNSALPQKDVAKMEKHVFRIYDENNDGHVDFLEFMVGSRDRL